MRKLDCVSLEVASNSNVLSLNFASTPAPFCMWHINVCGPLDPLHNSLDIVKKVVVLEFFEV